MLTRRNRDLLPHKTEPTPFAAKAKDLGALRDAVVDAAAVGAGFWISYLFALFYFAIAAGAVTDRDLLLESPVKLPFLNVELPLKAFFIVGPAVFLVLHAYVLLHFVLLAGKIGAFHLELQAQITGDDTRARLRRQLPSNIFVQFLSGPPEVKHGIVNFLLKSVAWISLIAGPILLLVLFQLQFLPYQNEGITSWQRIAVVIDLILLWLLWPPIARGKTTLLAWRDLRRVKVTFWIPLSLLPILLVYTIATFPGEWLEENPPPVPGWASLHELLVAGQVNYVTGGPHLWSNVLVLPYFEVGDRVLSLRGRSLEKAVLVFAHLRKADFTGASLVRADFTGADLREAKFEFNRVRGGNPAFFPIAYNKDIACNEDITCAQLQGANFSLSHLQGATFARAQLQGAIFLGAQLQGANLDQAQLQGVVLFQAHLQGASLNLAQLQGASLNFAQLQGASLNQAQLQGANLQGAQLQGASLDNAQLQGAVLAQAFPQYALLMDAQLDGAELRHSYVWRTYPPSNTSGAVVSTPEPRPKYVLLDCSAGECDWSETSYAALKSLIASSVPSGGQRDQALRQIAILGEPPYVADRASAEAWTNLATESEGSASLYFNTLAEKLKEIGCTAAGAPYVISSLMRQVAENAVLLDYRFQRHPSQEAEVATAFLDEAKCPGARGLSQENKAKLQEIRDRGLPTTPHPGAAAR